MATHPKLPLDEGRLIPDARRFAGALFERLPALKSGAGMIETSDPGRFGLWIELPSPTGDKDRRAAIWVEEGDAPSVGFGQWHTHADVWIHEVGGDDEDEAIIDLVEAILADRFVLVEDIGGEYDGHWDVLDLRREGVIDEYLTGPYCPGRIRIKSWSGKADREVSLDDLGVD